MATWTIRCRHCGQALTPGHIEEEKVRRDKVLHEAKRRAQSADEALKIAQSKNGFTLRVQYDERAPYLANVYLLVAYDKQVEITR